MKLFPLPSLDELRDLVVALLPLTGLLAPGPLMNARQQRTGPPVLPSLLARLSAAYSNIDEDAELEEFDRFDRLYLERQVERTRRENLLEAFPPQAPWRWTLQRGVGDLALADWSVQDSDEPYALLAMEVPLVTFDRRRAILRGQRIEPRYAEDFEVRFERRGRRWAIQSRK